MKRFGLLSGLLVVGVLSLLATQGQTRQNVAQMQKVKDNLYVIIGGGGNTAALVTEPGVIVVDTKVRGWGNAILDKIKSVTDKPVTTIINTHTHGDHVGSNPEFPATVEVIAHENCKASMEKMPMFQTEEGKKYLPKQTFKDKLSFTNGKVSIDLYYFGRGHTGGDTIVVFPALKVAHTGDLFAGKSAPIMDVNNGGSGVEYPKTLMKAASSIHGVETVIPGHSAVTDWKAFQEYGEFMRDFVAAVEQAHKEGKTSEQAAESLKLPDKYQGYNMGRARTDVMVIYNELKK